MHATLAGDARSDSRPLAIPRHTIRIYFHSVILLFWLITTVCSCWRLHGVRISYPIWRRRLDERKRKYAAIGAWERYLWGLLVREDGILHHNCNAWLEKLESKSRNGVSLTSKHDRLVGTCSSIVTGKSQFSTVVAFHTLISSFSPKHIFISRILTRLSQLPTSALFLPKYARYPRTSIILWPTSQLDPLPW